AAPPLDTFSLQQPDMGERCRRGQGPEAGSAIESLSAANAPPLAPSLLDLPAALLEDIMRRAMKLGAAAALAGTCSTFLLRVLQHTPALRIQLDSQRRDQLLSPRLVTALHTRTSKLALTFHQIWRRTGRYGEARYYAKDLTNGLVKLGSCPAVEDCRLSISASYYDPLDCTPGLAQGLVDSFPSLTALSLHGFSVTCSSLASLFSHPQLAIQLQQLDLTHTHIQQPEQPGPEAVAEANLFRGLRLKKLSLAIPLLPSLQPLAQHLTEEVDTLLAATQLTNIQLASIDKLSISRAEALCSWQQLELTGLMGFTAAAHLPLHSLIHPLVMNKLYIWFEDDSSSLSSAAHNLTLVCEVPVKVKCLQLYLKHHSLSHLAVPQPLCCLGYTEVWLNAVAELSAADVPALASMSHTCTHLYVHNSSLQPTLEFWCQLVQLMPTVQQVTFDHVIGADGKAMCELLQLMAEQPWARWLVITFSNLRHWELPECWQEIKRRFYNSHQPAKFRVSFGR
ncbi:hypothetical protein QJQ45_030353, partial [Haematococcus lacustris]